MFLTEDTSFDGLVIAEGETLELAPDQNITITITEGSLIVNGRLISRPEPHVTHEIVFADPQVDDGIWVEGRGQLVLEGAPKTRGWVKSSDAPAAWADSDSIVLAPIGWDEERNRPDYVTEFAGQLSDVGEHETEMANITRNIHLSSTGEGYAHLHINSGAVQSIKWVRISRFGQRDQLARYPLHFHHCGSASRGTVVEGVVVAGSDHHAFVPHMSHGITFRHCVAVDTHLAAFWWDVPEETHDTVIEDCLSVGAFADARDPGPVFHRMGDYHLGAGTGNIIRRCVSAGGRGGQNNAGFLWPEKGQGVWVAENLTVHNRRGKGVYVWQNTSRDHVVNNLTAYQNGSAGWHHGAYLNTYRVNNYTGWGNAGGDLVLQALSRGAPQVWNGMNVMSFRTGHHTLGTSIPVEIQDSVVRGVMNFVGTGNPELFVLDNVSVEGVWLGDDIDPESLIRWGNLELRPVNSGGPGEFVEAWNALVVFPDPDPDPDPDPGPGPDPDPDPGDVEYHVVATGTDGTVLEGVLRPRTGDTV